MSLIHIDYDNARAQARRLQEAADDCAAAERALQKELSNLPGYWSGEAADACAAVLGTRIQELQSMRRDAENLASTIRRVANQFEEKERQLKAALAAAEAAQKSNEISNAGNNPQNSQGSGGGGGSFW